MHISELYKSIYHFWDDTTPLYGDCGTLCQKACCMSDEEEEETGMYLFPGEKALFQDNAGFKILSSDFSYGKETYADLLICNTPCSRDERPLSCRIFPLIPYYKNGVLSIIQDPRAKSICPLAQKKALSYLNPTFILKTEKTFRLLLCFAEVRDFLSGLTEILDDYMKFDPTEEIV